MEWSDGALKIGVLEWWSNGVRVNRRIYWFALQILHYAMIPAPNAFEVENFKNSMEEKPHEG